MSAGVSRVTAPTALSTTRSSHSLALVSNAIRPTDTRKVDGARTTNSTYRAIEPDMNMLRKQNEMENRACPVLTPEELRFLANQKAAEETMQEKVTRAISDAATEAATNVREAGLELEPTSEGYFMFALQQVTFVRLCGGDPDSLRGGNPDTAEHIIRNCRNIVDTYWKASIEEKESPCASVTDLERVTERIELPKREQRKHKN